MAGKCLQNLHNLESGVCRAMFIPHTRVSAACSLAEDGLWDLKSEMEWENSRIHSSLLLTSVYSSALSYSNWTGATQG
ncbi:hypothetical protein LINPERPRIM_LOCUS9932 [Linum perenne]